MKAWLSLAAILLLGGFCLWQHFQLRDLKADLASRQSQSTHAPVAEHDVEKLVSGRLVDEAIQDQPSGLAIMTQLANAMATTGPARRVDIIERYQDGRPVVRFDGDAEFDRRRQHLNFRMVRPAPAAPGSRQPELLRYERVMLEPAVLPERPGTTLPYGLYGQ